MAPHRTLFEKIWDDHVVERYDDGTELIYIDRHIINEGTSVEAFAELNAREVKAARPAMHLCVPDHVVPTRNRSADLEPGMARKLVELLEANAAFHGIHHIPYRSRLQGICHVIAPELGFVLPGMIAVCGDSHTSTLGALGAVAFGIGTSEVGQVLASGALTLARPLQMAIEIDGALAEGVTAKDAILAIIGQIGTAGGTGYAIEYRGEAIAAMEVEARLTLCNMTIEAGARAGIIAPDDKTLAYLKGRALAPSGELWDAAKAVWQTLHSDSDAHFDRVVRFDGATIAPQVTWGTSPQDVSAITGVVPDPASFADPSRADAVRKALAYQGLEPGTPLTAIRIDQVFIGSCTNARLSDLREAARVVRGKRMAAGVIGFVAPGSTRVKDEAEAEGLDRVFTEAGFEWRASACSMCAGIEQGAPGTRVAATSNRNFENRQGRGVRTHLVSPAMAAAAAIAGHFVDVRESGGTDA